MKRYASKNVVTIVHHFASLEALIEWYGFEGERIWSFDKIESSL